MYNEYREYHDLEMTLSDNLRFLIIIKNRVIRVKKKQEYVEIIYTFTNIMTDH